MADGETQARLARVSEAFEDRLAAVGVRHIRHKDLQAFHITLGTLDGDLYPTQAALKAINSAVPPFSWAPQNFTVLRPACTGCTKARDKLAQERPGRDERCTVLYSTRSLYVDSTIQYRYCTVRDKHLLPYVGLVL